jgi:hypothetical protein
VNELNVKVGDKVLIDDNKLATVTKVTPTGRIKTDKTGKTQFDKYGKEMGGDIWYKSSISVPTEKDYKRLNELSLKRKAVNLMGRYGVDNLSVEQAQNIIKILGASY